MGERASTKGPWFLSDEEDDAYLVTSASRHDKVEICRVEIGFVGPVEGEQQANAHLIAAAPDLLDACKRASEILRGRGYPGWGIAKDILNEAIAKAEGLGQRADATPKNPLPGEIAP